MMTWGELIRWGERVGISEQAVVVLEVEVPGVHVEGKAVTVARALSGISNESTRRVKLRAT